MRDQFPKMLLLCHPACPLRLPLLQPQLWVRVLLEAQGDLGRSSRLPVSCPPHPCSVKVYGGRILLSVLHQFRARLLITSLIILKDLCFILS